MKLENFSKALLEELSELGIGVLDSAHKGWGDEFLINDGKLVGVLVKEKNNGRIKN